MFDVLCLTISERKVKFTQRSAILGLNNVMTRLDSLLVAILLFTNYVIMTFVGTKIQIDQKMWCFK